MYMHLKFKITKRPAVWPSTASTKPRLDSFGIRTTVRSRSKPANDLAERRHPRPIYLPQRGDVNVWSRSKNSTHGYFPEQHTSVSLLQLVEQLWQHVNCLAVCTTCDEISIKSTELVVANAVFSETIILLPHEERLCVTRYCYENVVCPSVCLSVSVSVCNVDGFWSHMLRLRKLISRINMVMLPLLGLGILWSENSKGITLSNLERTRVGR